MIDETKKVGLGRKHNPECQQALQDIAIPAGTLFRATDDGKYEAEIGVGAGYSMKIVVERILTDILPSGGSLYFKRVIS